MGLGLRYCLAQVKNNESLKPCGLSPRAEMRAPKRLFQSAEILNSRRWCLTPSPVPHDCRDDTRSREGGRIQQVKIVNFGPLFFNISALSFRP